MKFEVVLFSSTSDYKGTLLYDSDSQTIFSLAVINTSPNVIFQQLNSTTGNRT